MSRVALGMPGMAPPAGGGALRLEEPFPHAARRALGDDQLRRNLAHATRTIRGKRAAAVGELPDWEDLRLAGSEIKATTLARLHELLERFEAEFVARGGTVHWARDADEANAIITELIRDRQVDEVVKVKSMATQEIRLNEHLEAEGITAIETDLAELIVQLAGDRPSHILVPAIHRNRSEIRDLFRREIPGAAPDLDDDPAALAAVARAHLRERFLSARVAISGANFGVAETGTLCVVESEGNGRMCLTLPETLITVMGIEKLVPSLRDLEVFLQLLPRSSTGERMNPYTTMWTGVHPGDGPQDVHVVLLDNGRTRALADGTARSALHCIRCSACMNVCPVYERTGGHAYGSTYPGPIGAIITPLLTGVSEAENASLPFASSLCGACFDACPVRIDIPEILVHLRHEAVRSSTEGPDESGGVRSDRAQTDAGPSGQLDLALAGASWVLASGSRLRMLERLLPLGRLALRLLPRAASRRLPGLLGRWTVSRELPELPPRAFREEWRRRERHRRGGGGR